MQIEMELVSVHTHDDSGDVPVDAVRASFQSELGGFSLLVDEPSEVAALLAVWQPYKTAVDDAIANNQPWPAGPRYSLMIAPVAP